MPLESTTIFVGQQQITPATARAFCKRGALNPNVCSYGRSLMRMPHNRASEQRRTKAASQTRHTKSGESAYGTYSASEGVSRSSGSGPAFSAVGLAALGPDTISYIRKCMVIIKHPSARTGDIIRSQPWVESDLTSLPTPKLGDGCGGGSNLT